ncbi:hypothetical protein KVV02_005762 [Mortierella alpina]|uniref:Rap-GAP domain-containing protein n=1 Tax=Mortierella alpina TaxID=64518 RepID=A0A9P8A2V2_MORAP|nr:hypothetical protein KVV02_005762 [Mortierella alpina]
MNTFSATTIPQEEEEEQESPTSDTYPNSPTKTAFTPASSPAASCSASTSTCILDSERISSAPALHHRPSETLNTGISINTSGSYTDVPSTTPSPSPLSSNSNSSNGYHGSATNSHPIPSQICRFSSGYSGSSKTFNFLGALSPKTTKQKMIKQQQQHQQQQQQAEKELPPAYPLAPASGATIATVSLSESPEMAATMYCSHPFAASTPISPLSANTLGPVEHPLSPSSSSPSSHMHSMTSHTPSPRGKRFSIDLQDTRGQSRQLQHAPSHDSCEHATENKKYKEAHPHLGRRLSMAIGLSSYSPTPTKAQLQRKRPVSIDSLSALETPGLMTPQSELQLVTSGTEREKERKGGLMNNFMTRPRVMSTSDVPVAKSSVFAPSNHLPALGEGSVEETPNNHTSLNVMPSPVAATIENTDKEIGVIEGRFTEATSDYAEGNEGSCSCSGRHSSSSNSSGSSSRRQKFFMISRHGRDSHDSGSSGKSSIDRPPSSPTVSSFWQRKSSVQPMHSEATEVATQMFTGTAGSTRGLHPLDQQDPQTLGSLERLDFYGAVDLQQVSYGASALDGNMVETTLSHLRDGWTVSALSDSDVRRDGQRQDSQKRQQQSAGPNISTSTPSTSIASSTSAIRATTNTKSSRLGKIGRFKFPSLSIGNIHKSKSTVTMANLSPEPQQHHHHHHHHQQQQQKQQQQQQQQQQQPALSTLESIERRSLPDSLTGPTLNQVAKQSSPSLLNTSESVSTITSVNTTNMTALGEPSIPCSSSHDSFSSGSNVFEQSGAHGGLYERRTRQSLSGVLEAQSLHPHHSSTSGDMALNPLTTTLRAQLVHPLAPEGQHMGRVQSRNRYTAKGLFGSERFTSSTDGKGGGQAQEQGSWTTGGFPSGLFRRGSRRTVSASHILSNSIFAADGSMPEAPPTPSLPLFYRETGHLGKVPPVEYSQNKIDATISTVLDKEKGCRDQRVSLEVVPGSVGQYLFGNELQNMSFGQVHSETMASMEWSKGSEEDNSMDSFVTKENTTSNSAASRELPTPATDREQESQGQHDVGFVAATADSFSGPQALSLSAQVATSMNGPSSGAVTGTAECVPTVPSSKPRPLSPAAFSLLAAKNERRLFASPSPPHFLSAMEQSKSLASFPSEYDTHTRSSASLLPKHSMTTSYLYSTAANHNAYGPKPTVHPTKITAPASRATTGARNPSLPHLEPRNAVADYSPSVHYKRQRSMSLQDADLLTADQFIALMPDDLTPKRRFSSEEALSENPLWHASQRTKSIPIPDSPTALRSLLEMLRAKCDEVLHCVAAGSETREDKKGRTMTVGMTGNVTIRVQEATVDHITTTAWSEFPSEAQGRAGSGQHLGNESSASTAEGVRPECELDFDSTMAMDMTIETMGHVVARMIEVMAKYTSVNHLTAVYRRLDELRLKAYKALPMKTYCKWSSLDASQRHSENKEDVIGAVDEPMTKSDTATGNNETIGMASNEPERLLRGNQAVDQPIQLHMYQHQNGGSDDTDNSHSHAYMEQLNAVEDYIRSLLKAVESTMADYLQAYSRMFVLPTTGYRIEGCGDLKGTSMAPSRPDPQVALTSVKGTTSNTPPSSLLTRATAVQGIIAANAIDHYSLAGKYGDEFLDPCPSVSPSTTAEVPKGSTLVSGGMPMARVQSMPESKDEWRNTSSSTPLSNPTVVGGGIGGIGATGAGAGVTVAGGPDMSMLGEYSKEHMGHEAYYYRNWFLGREHRTFVGQVDGLGTVIISIIKDMVVPSEARPTPLANHNSGPIALSASSSSDYSSGSIGTAFGSGASLGSNLSRPSLLHSSQSFYPGRGVGGRLLSSTRTSSEAMRAILSASTAIATGAGSNAETHPSASRVFNTPGGAVSSSTPTNKQAAAATGTIPSATASTALSLPVHNSTTSLNSNKDSSSTARWQYRCILRQKDVDSLRITLPEPDPGPLNNLARRVGKPQWKTILQSIHPAITQQAASKLKKVQNNQQFEKELAKFDETMLRFNYKFGVLLVLPGQTREEDWFSNQMESSTNFQAFLEHGVLGQKVALKGFDRFSAGLDTRCNSPLCIIPLNRLVGEAGEYSYYDTWGEGFEIMYHVSTLLPYNTADRQQIQRKRHIGNDIVCIVFVDGDQPFVPNAIKSQFLHIFVVIRQIELSDGINGYSVAIACDEQVPDFGPPLPEPPVFKTPLELRAFLLCKMINGENAAYKAPRLIKPHQRARSGMLENLVAKANTLAKDKDSDRKQLKQQKAAATPSIAASTLHGYSTTMTTTSAPTTPAMRPTTSTIYCCQCHQQHLDDSFFRDHATGVQQYPVLPSSLHQPAYPCQPGHPLDCERAYTFSTFSTATPPYSPGDETRHPMRFMKANTISGTRASSRNSLTLGSELKGSLFKHRRRSSNVDGSKLEAMLKSNAIADNDSEKEWISASGFESVSRAQAYNFNGAHQTHAQSLPCSPMLTPSALSHLCSLALDRPRDHVNDSPRSMSSLTPTLCERAELVSPIIPNPTYHRNANGVSLQRAQSLASTPTESRFTVNRWDPHRERPSLPATMTVENSDHGSSLDNGFNKARSKSEIDLVLSPIQEGHQTASKRSTVPALGSPSSPSFFMQSQSTLTLKEHLQQNLTPSKAPTLAIMPHPSMKGRAHNFLTTLVRRRASSNDTSSLTPTPHPDRSLLYKDEALHLHLQEHTMAATSLPQPLKRKDSYKSKSLIHIDTQSRSSSNPAFDSSSSTTAYHTNGTSNSVMRTSTGTSTLSYRSTSGTSMSLTTPTSTYSSNTISPPSLRSFTSREALYQSYSSTAPLTTMNGATTIEKSMSTAATHTQILKYQQDSAASVATAQEDAMSGEDGQKDTTYGRDMATVLTTTMATTTTAMTDYLTYKSPSFSTSRDSLLQQRFDPDYVRPRSSNDHHVTSRADHGFAGELRNSPHPANATKAVHGSPLCNLGRYCADPLESPEMNTAVSVGASGGGGGGGDIAWVDSPEAELEEVCTKTAFDEGELLIESPQIPTRQVKRAVSEESFLKRTGSLARTSLLRSKGTGLQETCLWSPVCCMPHHGNPAAIVCPNMCAIAVQQQQQQQHVGIAEVDVGMEDASFRTFKGRFAPSILRSRIESRVRKSGESQRNQYKCSLEVEEPDMKRS